MKDMYNRRNIP